MRILYVFPHPDDESFGPALAMARQRRSGHSIHLLTLTRGGATRQRHQLGLSVDEMGAVRHAEMLEVGRVLGLDSMTVLDHPDSGLGDLDPRTVEQDVIASIQAVQPSVVVTYAPLGVSGFRDHVVTHAVVKRAWCEVAAGAPYLKRLALFTVGPEVEQSGPFTLHPSRAEDIDCIVPVDRESMETARRALACYRTYQSTIEAADPLKHFTRGVPFELWRESFETPVDDLVASLP